MKFILNIWKTAWVLILNKIQKCWIEVIFPSVLTSSFTSKLKSLSNLDPSVCEVPQLGKLCFKVDEMTLIASISAFPTIFGRKGFVKNL